MHAFNNCKAIYFTKALMSSQTIKRDERPIE